MRLLVQRVNRASVEVDGLVSGKIDRGLLVLIGVRQSDGQDEMEWLVNKVSNLRIFPDAEGKMNLSVKDIEGQVLVVSQFTLYGDAKKGNRPSYNDAAEPEKAEKLYLSFVERLSEVLGKEIPSGVFGAHMKIDLINDGPVTILLEKDS